MKFQRNLVICTFGAVLSVNMCGCGPMVKVAGKFLGKGALQTLKQGTKQGTKQGVKQGDDVLSKGQFWKTPKPKNVSPGARGAATAVMSAARVGAAKAFTEAADSTVRCGEKLVRVNQNYNLFAPTSRVAVRIIIQKLAENSSRLDEINLQLADSSLSDRKAAQLRDECQEIDALNGKLEAKIEALTLELG